MSEQKPFQSPPAPMTQSDPHAPPPAHLITPSGETLPEDPDAALAILVNTEGLVYCTPPSEWGRSSDWGGTPPDIDGISPLIREAGEKARKADMESLKARHEKELKEAEDRAKKEEDRRAKEREAHEATRKASEATAAKHEGQFIDHQQQYATPGMRAEQAAAKQQSDLEAAAAHDKEVRERQEREKQEKQAKMQAAKDRK